MSYMRHIDPSPIALPPRQSQNRISVRLDIVLILLSLLNSLFGFAVAVAEDEPRKKVDLNFQIRLILSDKCFNYRGPDLRQRRTPRLDTKVGALGTNKSGGCASRWAVLKTVIWTLGLPLPTRTNECPNIGRRCLGGKDQPPQQWIDKAPIGRHTGRSCRQRWQRFPMETSLASQWTRFFRPGSSDADS